jgi:AcrR family transcriptional regulator
MQTALTTVWGMTTGGRVAEARGSDAKVRDSARERILNAAYELFSHHGVHAVGIDRIIAEANVAKATLYHHFASKVDLVLAFLDLRERRWTYDWLEAEVERLAATPQARALAVFDALDEWFRRPDFEGCAFINTLLEITDKDDPVHIAAVRHLSVIRAILAGYAEQAGAANPEEIGDQLQILAMGAIVSADRGDRHAARRARGLAELLVKADSARRSPEFPAISR